MFIDELLYVKEPHFAALTTALHRCAQAKLPVTVFGAGLPQLLARAGEAKSLSERLFDCPCLTSSFKQPRQPHPNPRPQAVVFHALAQAPKCRVCT